MSFIATWWLQALASNRPFVPSRHMVRNKLCWDPKLPSGTCKTKESWARLVIVLLLSPTAQFTSQHNLFRTMWPDRVKGPVELKALCLSTNKQSNKYCLWVLAISIIYLFTVQYREVFLFWGNNCVSGLVFAAKFLTIACVSSAVYVDLELRSILLSCNFLF